MNSAAVNWEIACYGVEVGELTSAEEVLAFFEKPWNWPELEWAWNEAREREVS